MNQQSVIKLHSEDHEEILNVIDGLRSEGISKYINLPQIIVCGDQSSGKSSVLEAISGLDFPRRDNVCTRFAIELVLRRSEKSELKASILPYHERSKEEKERLESFNPPPFTLEKFAEVVAAATEHLRIGKHEVSFTRDILRVEVSDPTQHHLTLVDLPGLYHAADESQAERDVELVEQLVLSYMENSRSVILAVLSAKSDIALQKVTAFIRKVDPRGTRTMGIITKPDTLSVGSDMEQSFYSLATNRRLNLAPGWHVLKNRKFEERAFSLAERNGSEQKFLSEGKWASLPRSQAGIESLRPKLSHTLKNHILSQLPSLLMETTNALRDAEIGLEKLGDARQTVSEQRRYLLRSSERFTALITNAVYGIYEDPFFGDAMEDKGYERRFRSVVQNRLIDLSEKLNTDGADRVIIDDKEELDGDDQRQIHRSDYLLEVRTRMRRSRGRELIGTFNPLIIGDLFFLQCRPWKGIIDQCIEDLLDDMKKAALYALKEVLDEQSLDGVIKYIVNSRFNAIDDAIRATTKELLRPHEQSHPITYNRRFIEIIHKSREERSRALINKKLSEFFGQHYQHQPRVEQRYTFAMESLVAALSTDEDTDMELFSCSEATDCMLAYYEIAKTDLIDDFGRLAAERNVLKRLLEVFASKAVEELSDEAIGAIAAEDQLSRMERHRLQTKLDILRRSVKQLHSLDRHNLKDKYNETDPPFGTPSAADDNDDVRSDNVDAFTAVTAKDASPDSVHLMDEEPVEEVSVLDEVEATSGPILAQAPVAEEEDWVPPTARARKLKKHSRSSLWE